MQGTPASGGVGAGLLARRDGSHRIPVQPRSVISAGQPIPNLAALLWDAAAVVTETGSPAAHLFESARALRVPAVCGVTIPPGDWIVAVDGQDGIVATIPLIDEEDV
jgi:phosphoenolpyruvate-protein kinase (PTS system EI component)